MKDIVKKLRKELEKLEKLGLPEGCEGFSRHPIMPGTAFFPGGDGVWKGEPVATVSPLRREVLVLGSDFGDSDSYEKRVKRRREFPQELDGPTWRNLLSLMHAAEIRHEQWFCTNAWPCMRKGNRGVGGKPPGARDAAFTNRCVDFFRKTREWVQPRLIIPLGLIPTAFLAKAYGTVPSSWGNVSSWRQIDEKPIWQTNDCVIVPVTHPSMPNRRHRRKYNTEEAEASLIRDAWAMTNKGHD